MAYSIHSFRYDSIGLKSDITASKWEAYNNVIIDASLFGTPKNMTPNVACRAVS